MDIDELSRTLLCLAVPAVATVSKRCCRSKPKPVTFHTSASRRSGAFCQLSTPVYLSVDQEVTYLGHLGATLLLLSILHSNICK